VGATPGAGWLIATAGQSPLEPRGSFPVALGIASIPGSSLPLGKGLELSQTGILKGSPQSSLQ